MAEKCEMFLILEQHANTENHRMNRDKGYNLENT